MSKLLELVDKERFDLSKVDVFESEEQCIHHVVAYILNKKIYEVKLMPKINFTKEQTDRLNYILDLMCNKNIPFQYITGRVTIYNEEYIVDESVLIPRQDTECIIEEAIKYINKYNCKSMLDLCTGSGVIGISVAKNSSIQDVLLLDISSSAVDIAKKNIELNSAQTKCKTIVSDMFTSLLDTGKLYDIITANPPYISKIEYEKLSPYVKREPKNALIAEDNGLYFYKKIATEAKNFLNQNGWLLFEIGFNEAKDVVNILEKEGYLDIQVIKDLNMNDRVVICRFLNK